ncbi:ATP-binding protein [Aminithiophilus ramosus]|uniref:DNA mismatch repair protein MutL n=1 Tax=Aminithiophilus ramosus TaxID=3029084 RepID=A0A9Q7AKK7_9BACT|nr:DNA mismatch repair endonuclease MutL [Aminithiophilus ramosus]QTX31243.1 ATP-binding protein [Aminithiophilus ramosus]
MRIERLPHDVAMRIAAGEVVERPVSVVKELLENALDADSRRISIFLSQGGKSSLVVEDDGRGIAFDDLPLALERHATSKLSSLEDMEAIATLGFRGEALPSLAAVSRFEIRSRSVDDARGGVLRVEGGQPLLHAPLDLPRGTRVQVDDLFFNLPARRKFLKSASAELRRILSLVQAYALAYADRAFLVQSEGRTVFLSPGDGDVAALLRSLWGDDPPLRHLDVSVESFHALGWWQPAPGRGKSDVTAFVNRRRVQEGLFRAALASPGGDISGQWLVFLETPLDEVDVNIHPAKTEVRFRKSGPVFEVLRRLAMAFLERPQSFSLDRKGPPGAQERGGESLFSRVAQPRLLPFLATAPTPASSTGCDALSTPSSPTPPRESFGESPVPSAGEEDVAPTGERRYLGQLQSGYLLFEVDGDLFLVDPHASHERIHFERFSERGLGAGEIQPLTMTLPLAPTLAQRVEPFLEALETLGFRFERGEGGLALAALPALPDLAGLGPEELLRGTVASLEEPREEERFWSVWRRWATLACKASVKLTTVLEPLEAEALWDDLFRCRRPWACPHGRPTTLTLSARQMGRHFGRE